MIDLGKKPITSEILFNSECHPRKYISVVTNEYINITSDVIDENIKLIGDGRPMLSKFGKQ
jgi:hypothetical protein